jgi:hypothetical protein
VRKEKTANSFISQSPLSSALSFRPPTCRLAHPLYLSCLPLTALLHIFLGFLLSICSNFAFFALPLQPLQLPCIVSGFFFPSHARTISTTHASQTEKDEVERASNSNEPFRVDKLVCAYAAKASLRQFCDVDPSPYLSILVLSTFTAF